MNQNKYYRHVLKVTDSQCGETEHELIASVPKLFPSFSDAVIYWEGTDILVGFNKNTIVSWTCRRIEEVNA